MVTAEDVSRAAASPDPSALVSALASVLSDSSAASLDHTRALVGQILAATQQIPAERAIAVLTEAISALMQRNVSFEDCIVKAREILSEKYTERESFTLAAQTLQGIPLESSTRKVEEGYKLNIYLRIAELYLEDDESGHAETAINRAAVLVHDNTDKLNKLRYKVAYTRVLDAKRKFIDAAGRYYELSTLVPHEEEQMQSLGLAVKCAILAEAGPRRSRILASLYKDERTHRLDSFVILEKMFMARILKSAEVKSFASTLAQHQLATTADGTTVLDRAVQEHNLFSAAGLYDNISFEGLGSLLEISPEMAEHLAANMVSEGRMKAIIDQERRLIVFRDEETQHAKIDDQIISVCSQINSVIAKISVAYPALDLGI